MSSVLPQNQQAANAICLTIHTNSIIHSSFKKCLVFQFLITIYYCILTFASMNTQNTRIIIYCLFFVFNEFFKMVTSHLDSIDPLGIGSIKFLLECLGWACKVNMVYQLCILAYLEEPLPLFIMFVHFIVANYRIHRPDSISPNSKGRSLFKVMDFINPILLYSFLKEFDSEQSDLSLIFLIFLCINLLFASQIRLILTHQETDLLGWLNFSKSEQEEQGEMAKQKQLKWNREQALKLLVIQCCSVLVIENFLLFFESIKNEVCLNIMHTLVIAFTAFMINMRGGSNF